MQRYGGLNTSTQYTDTVLLQSDAINRMYYFQQPTDLFPLSSSSHQLFFYVYVSQIIHLEPSFSSSSCNINQRNNSFISPQGSDAARFILRRLFSQKSNSQRLRTPTHKYRRNQLMVVHYETLWGC